MRREGTDHPFRDPRYVHLFLESHPFRGVLEHHQRL